MTAGLPPVLSMPVPAPRPSAGLARRLGDLPLRSQFHMLLAVVVLALMLLVLGTLLELRRGLGAQSRESLDASLDAATAVLVHFADRERSGALDRPQAQARAIEALTALHEGDTYFFAFARDGHFVLHGGDPVQVGRPVRGLRDADGRDLYEAFAEAARSDASGSGRGGFVEYPYVRPGATQPEHKLSQVRTFEPWGWVIGSGIYVGDLREAVQRQLAVDAAIVLGSLLLAGYLFLSFYRVMDGGLKETRRHLRAMTSGDLTTSPSPWGRDEAADLMRALSDMQEALRAIVRDVRGGSDDMSRDASAGKLVVGRQELDALNSSSVAELLRKLPGAGIFTDLDNPGRGGRSTRGLTDCCAFDDQHSSRSRPKLFVSGIRLDHVRRIVVAC